MKTHHQLLKEHRRMGQHQPDPHDPRCIAFMREIYAKRKRKKRW